jgi:NAD-dependent DNA ligase
MATEKETLIYRAHAIGQRQVDEMIGIIKGIMSDGQANASEIGFLLQWLEANQTATTQWPASVIYPRILAAISDGHIDPIEQQEITELLSKAIGNDPTPPPEAQSNSTQLPLCDPKPQLVFENKVYCFTGKFYAGSRSWCEQQILAKGGQTAGTITKKIDYLVIGELGSGAWLHSTHGRKIEQAIQLRTDNRKPNIIDEQYWISHFM